MRPYSNDLRKRVFIARSNGDKVDAVAKRFSVGVRFVYTLMERFRKTGSYEAKKNSGGAPRKLTEEDERKIQQAIKNRPDITLAEIKEQCNLQVSIPTIQRAVKRLEVTVKKKHCIPKNKTVQEFSR
jgi:putative transposase